jgi:hypothetical protein
MRRRLSPFHGENLAEEGLRSSDALMPENLVFDDIRNTHTIHPPLNSEIEP